MRRILFFHQGAFSGTNASVLAGLKERFSRAEIRCVDIHGLLKKRRLVLIANGFLSCWHYGGDLLMRRRDLDDSFFSTRYIFRVVRLMALRIHKGWPADCSFQTQSMFDCSCAPIPHFVYTDHTYASCKSYPAYGKHIWAPVRREWLIHSERSVYHRAARIFTMSHNVAQDLVSHYGIEPERVQSVGVGCNADVERLNDIPIHLERYKSKNILFVGREWQRKGGPQLLEAFHKVRGRHAKATLTIVGVTPNVSSEGVEVVGSVPLETLNAYYEDASLFCVPSQVEPFGIVFLEAMAAGLPVVGLRLGAAPDFILPGETGALVTPHNNETLADALIDLLNDPAKCSRMGARGRALVKMKYTWDHVCALMAERMTSIITKAQ